MNPEAHQLSETRSARERVHRRELLDEANLGLQARLLLGDFTSPRLSVTRKKLLPIQENGAQGISEATKNVYQTTSLTQRRRYQEETGLTYTRWRDGMNLYLHTVRQDTKNSKRKEFLETLGITDMVGADDFYNEYLRGKSDIIKFVDDVETLATREQIEKNADIIRSLGNAFGYESSEVINHLIDGVRNVKEDVRGFIRGASQQVNAPGVLETPLVRSIRKDSGMVEVEKEPKAPPVKKVEEKVVPKMAPAKKTRIERAPSRKIDIEEEEAEQPGKRTHPAAKHKETETQIYPAPLLQHERTDMPLTDDELEEVQNLLYDDVLGGNPQGQAEVVRISERLRYYARELHTLVREYGQSFVMERAGTAVGVLQKDLKDVGLKSDKQSKSKSWYLWGIAKSRFLAKNPDIQSTLPNAAYYDPADPLLHYRIGQHAKEGKKSHIAEEDIINGMMGWEAYRQRKKVNDILSHLDPLMAPADKRRLQELLSERPKPDFHTLSSYQLREIGKLIRGNKQKQ